MRVLLCTIMLIAMLAMCAMAFGLVVTDLFQTPV